MITVLADDLSGAAEVAGVFLDRAVPISLQLTGYRSSTPLGVVVTDLNTRAMAPQAAAQAVRAALAEIPAEDLVIKKIDSLLRGHIRDEVAVLAERGPVVVGAALPALGRTVSDGVLYLGDAPLHETSAWAAEGGVPPHTVAELFTGLDADGRITICDAVSDSDLDAIVADSLRTPGTQLVGTAALTAAVARTLPAKTEAAERSQPSTSVLTVVGTAAPTAATQVEALTDDGVRLVTVDARALLHDKADPEPLQWALERGRAVVRIGGVVDTAERQAVSAALGRLIAVAQAQHRPDLVLTGGETARAVVEAIGVQTLRPIHQIHHGAVVSVAADGRRVVTRPGSFGDADSLLAIVRYLTQDSEDNS
jgi:uncharacterized protein YgbK (DUF1537 family)